MSEKLVQLIPAQPGHRVILVDCCLKDPARADGASWRILPVVAWGLLEDREEGGLFQRVVALYPDPDGSLDELSWNRSFDDPRQFPQYAERGVWLMLGPGDADPTAEECAAEWTERHERWLLRRGQEAAP